MRTEKQIKNSLIIRAIVFGALMVASAANGWGAGDDAMELEELRIRQKRWNEEA